MFTKKIIIVHLKMHVRISHSAIMLYVYIMSNPSSFGI